MHGEYGARRRALAGAVLVACLLSGCTAEPAAPESHALRVSDVVVHEGSATIVDGASDRLPLETGDTVSAGDSIEVEGTGALIELTWTDGSITRLGEGTTLLLGSPGDPLGARGTQTGGRTWNRVAADDGTAPYLLDVSGGERAGALGDVFVVDCRTAPCRIAGSGSAAGDGSKTTFRRDGVESLVTAGPASWSELIADPWGEANAAADESAGHVPVAALFADADPSRGVLAGTFDVLRTGRVLECAGGACGDLTLIGPGETRDLVFRFTEECSAGTPCATSVDTQTIDIYSGALIDATVPLITGAGEYSWGTTSDRAVCLWTYEDGSTIETGRSTNPVLWSVTPTRAEVRDGVFVVTELRGTTQSSMSTTEPTSPGFPGCEYFQIDWHAESDLVMTRRDG